MRAAKSLYGAGGKSSLQTFYQNVLSALLVLAVANAARAGIALRAYTPDTATPHLWHFDGAGTLTTDEVQTAALTLTNFPQNASPGTTIGLGNASYSSAFKTCLHIAAANFLTSPGLKKLARRRQTGKNTGRRHAF